MDKDSVDTFTYIPRPSDNRCTWWSAVLPALEVKHLDESKMPLDYFKSGRDYELEYGSILIDSEANHHRHNRGFNVLLGFVSRRENKILWISPTLERKMYIKEKGRKDLMKGTGDVAGVIRMALYIQGAEDPESAFYELSNV